MACTQPKKTTTERRNTGLSLLKTSSSVLGKPYFGQTAAPVALFRS
jgi:hypothetical protein